MQVFEFSSSSPPSDEQLVAIAKLLLKSLCNRTDVAFEATDAQVESGSWVTLKIRSIPIHEHLTDMVFVGIVSYSLRDTKPSIQSVLLPFSKRKRLKVGRNSILVANYVESGAGGEWEDFTWAVDEYGEWDCDDLPVKSE